MTISRKDLEEAFKGVILGTAVGDALGLPSENLSPQRIRKWWKDEWRMRLLFGRGMISDDTEHTLMVAQALLSHSDNPVAFQKTLGWKLRWWFVCLPGGVGLATAKACLKLWIGFSPERAGVSSGGSGPAMRSGIIGAFFANDPVLRRKYVTASSQLTHRSWQAETAAMAVAESVALAVNHGKPPESMEVFKLLRGLSHEDEWITIVAKMELAYQSQLSVGEFVTSLGLKHGVTGYALHVVPVALFAWLHHPDDFRNGLIRALECGGDTDTVGAILGALIGANVGIQGIPEEWRQNIWEWPRTPSFMERIAGRLAEQKKVPHPLGPIRYFWPGVLLRNFLFLTVILTHGFRRLVPPY